MALKGNKGEWSEIYVFLKLLADGKLDAADANLNALPNIYYPLVKILREEINSKKRDYVWGANDIVIIDGITGNELLKVPVADFIDKSKQLFAYLKGAKGRSFDLDEIEIFLSTIQVSSLTATSTDKADIKIVVHDLNTGKQPLLGFSIKSMIGKDSTLFNAGAGTNFIYKLIIPKDLIFDINEFNKSTLLESHSSGESKIKIRINKLDSLGIKLEFEKIQSENLQLNLQLIDSKLPELFACLLCYKFGKGISKFPALLEQLNKENPLNFNISKGHPFYEYKIKSLLTDNALGMTPETIWHGKYDATGGIIIVKGNGDLVCYHIYNKNEFQDYLMNHTRLEQASTSEDENNPGFAATIKGTKPFKYGWVYEENGSYYIKLNLQIRIK